ncbi:unnamed protein product [Adineta steineri]|uniref:Transmembrane protein n=1 Tax=Adineta steineri TaxID=433720 RepID=A0A814NHG2_9BILA|nr:unnamed protein product [Adineta steineri]CAF1274872.1 unnamed protein product [Adineta steineri]
MLTIIFFYFLVSLISAKSNFEILITVNESTSYIDDINGLSTNRTFIYLLYTYTEPYQLVKLNTSTMLPISQCILPYHYNDTIGRQLFFLLPYTDDLMFVGFIQNLYKPEGFSYLQGIDLQSMTVNENINQTFPFQTFTKFVWFQSIPEKKKILANFWQWDITTNELTKPRITGGKLPSNTSYDTWLLPSMSPAEPPQLFFLCEKYIVYTLNISSSTKWNINKQLSKISLDFLIKSISFHLDTINSTTIAVIDEKTNIYIYNLYNKQLTLTFNLRQLFPDYPRMSEQIPNNLRANEEFIYITSSTNVEPYDQQYLFRIDLNNIPKNIDLIQISDENFGLTQLIPSKDTVYSFERLYEAENYFNIYKIGTPLNKN